MVTNGTPLVNLTVTAKSLRNCITEVKLAPLHTWRGVTLYLRNTLVRI